jgi:hypothetical protein
MNGAEPGIESTMPVTAIIDADRLLGLASEINAEHAAAEESARDAVTRACRAGKLLIQAKHKVGHGNWEDWVKDKLKLTARTASTYMRLAGKLPRLPKQQAEHVKELTLREAINYLKEPAGKTEGKEKQPVSAKSETVSDLKPDASWIPFVPPMPSINTNAFREIPVSFEVIVDRMAIIFRTLDTDDAALFKEWDRFRDEDKPNALQEIRSRIDRLVELHRRLGEN